MFYTADIYKRLNFENIGFVIYMFDFSVLLEKVLPCILTETQTKYGKTCTKKQQHNIIIANKDSIQTFVQIDPQTCMHSLIFVFY